MVAGVQDLLPAHEAVEASGADDPALTVLARDADADLGLVMVRLISVVACGPGCGNHHENTHNDTWKESGYEQAGPRQITLSLQTNSFILMTYKIAFFDTKPYDKTFFDKANDDFVFSHNLIYFSWQEQNSNADRENPNNPFHKLL